MDEASERGIDFDRAARAFFAQWLVAASRALAARRAEALGAVLLALMAFNLLSAIAQKTITNDEVVHIPAGYYHLVAGDFRLNNEHPPLIKMWAALPLLFIQPEEPPAVEDPGENFMERTWGYDARFWQANRARFETISFWPRVMMLPLTLALGLLIFVYARKLFGARAALLALALYTFEPTILAHGRVVHTDAPAALMYLLFFITLHRYAEAPNMRRALMLGLAAGLALSTKFSMLILLPVAAAAFVALLWAAPRIGQRRGPVAAHAAAVGSVALFIVNAAYYFRSVPLTRPDVQWVALKSAEHFGEIMAAIGWLSNVVPTYFLFGFYNVAIHNQYGHGTSLLGEHSTMGWWYYFPAAFALKTTLPFLLLTVAALSWSLWKAITKHDKRHFIVLAPLALYTLVSVTSHINIGIRHFLPAFPFLFIMGGAFLDRVIEAMRRPRWAGPTLVVVLLGWIVFEIVRAYPHYTPYMNQLASTHPRWWYLSDSNVEWGDDVGALAAYLKARGETRVGGALSGGWTTLALYGVEYVNLMPGPGEPVPPTRYTAIGAGFLNGSTVLGGEPGTGRETDEKRINFFDAYRRREPEAVFGHSIYLYREHE